MPTATLRFIPQQAKKQLAPAKYEALTVAVSRYLFHTVSLPDAELDVTWARAFVCAYIQDAARHTVQFLDDGEFNGASLSVQEYTISTLTLQLAGRLANVQGGLNVPALVDLAVVYGRRNTTLVQTTFSESFRSTPGLLEEFKTEVLQTFAEVIQNPDRRCVYVLSELLHCSHQVALLFAEDQEFVLGFARSYQVTLDNLAASRGGMVLHTPNKMDPWQKDWLYTKTGFLDAFNAMVQALLNSLSRPSDHIFDILFAILDLPSSSTTPKTPFISQTLIADYQYAFDLSSMLGEKLRGSDDPRVDLLVFTLTELSRSPRGPKPGVLSALQGSIRPRDIAPMPMIDIKGKGKAIEQEPEVRASLTLPSTEVVTSLPKDEGTIELAVSQVLDIFPDETPEHIRRCLQHQGFDSNAEKLISALLEGNLPVELANDNSPQEISKDEEFKYTKDRHNVWDEFELDFSRLRIGKRRDDADELLQDRSWVEQMKADIIRRAEELSDDEEAEVRPRDVTVAFEEELDEDVESLVDKGVKVAGDGEESDDNEGEGNVGDHAISPETILEIAYLEDPKLFARDAATRRSKSRADLKTKTGWGDEQIEGWRIMLERNPKKDKILQKHEFAGNAPLVPTTNSPGAGMSDSARDGPSHRGGGGTGRGRGGGGDSARGRAGKDKNKARQANHNRKRGHDKKMARGGGGMPV